MKQPGLILCMILGSFCVYCGQRAVDGGDGGRPGDGGFISDARADGGACCTQPGPTFAKLAEGDLVAGTLSPAIPVGSYHDVVIYVSQLRPVQTNGCISPSVAYFAYFRPDAATPFGYTGQYLKTYDGGRLRVDGTDLQLHASTSCTVHYVIAGVQ